MSEATSIGEVLRPILAELAALRAKVEKGELEIAELRSQVAQASVTIWTYDDVVRFLRVSKRKVEQLVSQGRIPCFHIGRTVRFDRAKVEARAKRELRPVGTERFYSRPHAPGKQAESPLTK